MIVTLDLGGTSQNKLKEKSIIDTFQRKFLQYFQYVLSYFQIYYLQLKEQSNKKCYNGLPGYLLCDQKDVGISTYA